MEPLDYKDLIKKEFDLRRDRNPKYSLRALARDLEISPSRLSEVLNGRHDLSAASAARMAALLNFSAEMSEYFVYLVEAKNSRSPRKRRAAKAKLKKADTNIQFKILEEEYFRVIADWFHFAILELIKLEGFCHETPWIARQLGISEVEAKEALLRLEKVGLVTRTKGRIELTNYSVSISSPVPSAAIQKAHRQILKRSSESLGAQHPDQREYSANMIAIDPDELAHVKKMIRNFRRKLVTYLDKSQKKQKLYCLSMQFFELTQTEKPK